MVVGVNAFKSFDGELNSSSTGRWKVFKDQVLAHLKAKRAGMAQ